MHQPDASSEELLIIQKVSNCFDDNRECLDLLALGKNVLKKESYIYG
ncbi:hypothetical protein PTQ53_18625 [Klebsiella michiganensis]|nr:hypothetical protein [Klebsiella michiganensis]ELC0837565.1 hypothetical protein [Klebsiella michiganensis]ELF4772228.1 hypothetical protein [Klebsiella michiganensis]ELP0294368.1 hypothetical protein [Klebsiella michiganensis]ELS4548719.1 hypothetical protein [Klebsiella michiganensis]MDS7761126.1 hypothetical protein [Klebsiella michiganensis]